MKNQITAAEILKNYSEKKQNGRDMAEAIEALHPFAVSRIAKFCDSDFDDDYVMRFKGYKGPIYLIGDALTAPVSRVSPVEKAKVWIHYIGKNHDDVEHYLARLVAKEVPGFKDFQNLSSDCLYAIMHPFSQGNRFSDGRAKSRRELEPFLRGTDTSLAVALNASAAMGSPGRT